MKSKRLLGLDLLRIISMLGIIGLHVINQGGLIEHANIYSINYYVILALLIFFYTSVNTFGLLSGYLNISKKNNKNSRIVHLLFIVVYYCLIITGVFYVLNLFNIRFLGYKNLIFNLFPFLDDKYWYICCYTFLFFMFPYINSFCKSLKKDDFKKLLILLFVLLTIVPNLLLKDVFRLLSGYSPFWLLYCYMIGAYIRLYDISLNRKKVSIKLLVVFIIAMIFNSFVRNIGFLLFGKVVKGYYLINYVSPLTLIMSVFLLLLFSDIKKKSNAITIYLSEMAFSVYIIHCHRIIFDMIFKDLFISLLNYNSIVVFLGIVASITMIYLICCIIDEVRKIIFKLFRIDKLIVLLGEGLDKVLN